MRVCGVDRHLLALAMAIHVAAKRLGFAELEGAEPALVYVAALLLPLLPTLLLLEPCIEASA